MPYKGHRVVVVTPAGRRRYLELLIPQVVGLADIVDEYQLWVNTTDSDDIAYMENVQSTNTLVKLIRLPDDICVNGSKSICNFFKKCIEPNTIYIRFDDDIVLLDTKEAFISFLDFRIGNPQFFLVYGCILNNAITSHLLQRSMQLDTMHGISTYQCMCPVGWRNGEFAKNVHNQIAQNNFDLSKFRMGSNWLLYDCERVSINCISWIGTGLDNACGGIVGAEEEYELSTNIPRKNNMINIIFGGFCCVHFAFYTQRDDVDPMLNIYYKTQNVLSLHSNAGSSTSKTAKLVVAKYKEDVSWLEEIKIPYIIYDKSNGQYPNIGREAETYIRFIIDNYDNLPDHIFFVQGNPFDHINIDKKDEFFTIINDSINASYDDYYALNGVKIEMKGRHHDMGHDMVYQSLKELLGISKVSVCYATGAQFIVPRQCILNHPKPFYANIHNKMFKEDISSVGSSLVCPWTMEKMWPYIFRK